MAVPQKVKSTIGPKESKTGLKQISVTPTFLALLTAAKMWSLPTVAVLHGNPTRDQTRVPSSRNVAS